MDGTVQYCYADIDYKYPIPVLSLLFTVFPSIKLTFQSFILLRSTFINFNYASFPMYNIFNFRFRFHACAGAVAVCRRQAARDGTRQPIARRSALETRHGQTI